MNQAHIAQSVEHFLGKEEVSSSNLDMSSSFWVARKLAIFRKNVNGLDI